MARRTRWTWVVLLLATTAVVTAPVVAHWRWRADMVTLVERLIKRAEPSVFTAER